MTLKDDPAAQQSSARQQKYLVALCTAETLEMQLEQTRLAGLWASIKFSARALVASPGEPPAADAMSERPLRMPG